MTAWLAVDLLAAGSLLLLGGYVVRRRPPGPLRPWLALFHVFALLYVAGDVLTQVARSPGAETLGIAVLYSGTIPLSAITWIIALRYAKAEGRPLALPRALDLALPVGWALATWGLMITNPWHGLYLTPVIGARNLYHPAWWASSLVGYAWIAGAVGVFGALAWRAPHRDLRTNALLLMGAASLSLASHWAYVLWPAPPGFDPLVLGLCGASALLLVGIYRTRLFRLLPTAWSEIVRHDPNGVLIADGEGRVVHANPAARRLLALSGLPHTGLWELLASRLRDAGGGTGPPDVGSLRALLAEASPPGGGPVFRVEGAPPRLVRLEGVRVPGRRGEASARCVRLCDVTEAWHERERRRASEERYRGLVAHAPLGVLACDREGRILVTNDRMVKILGSPHARLAQGADLFTVPALREAGIAGLFERCLARSEPLVEEISADVPALGGRIEARFHLDVVRDAAGRVAGVQSLVEDLRAERRLEAVGAAAGGVLHDFRNLLGTILLQAELVSAEPDREAQRDHVARLRRAARHACDLLARLLEPADRSPEPSQADVGEVVREVAQLVAGELPEGVRLQLELPPDLPPAPVPPAQLRQVVSNLLLNGAESMRGRGGGGLHVLAGCRHVAPGELARCAVPSGRSGPTLYLRIRDEGAGIDPRDLGELFAPFFSRREGGTGLGLVNVAHVVRAHQGAVDVESRPAAGSTFTVFLPQPASPARRPGEAVEPPVPPSA